ncbi:MAG: hypothetical protein GW778_03860 [Alphaproteobacteria bacterium]|nr:hypothetical protein [Alphaproteobacteria bacterium]
MEKFQKHINLAVILAETSHIFCCVLPTVISILSLLVGVGVVGTLPISLLVVHDFLHQWELPIIISSGLLLAVGWGVLIYSRKVDCVEVGCCDKPCAPKKRKSSRLLEVATILFVVNVSVYAIFHRGMNIQVPHAADARIERAAHQGHDHDHGHAH